LSALAALILLENLHPEGQHSHHGFLDRLIELVPPRSLRRCCSPGSPAALHARGSAPYQADALRVSAACSPACCKANPASRWPIICCAPTPASGWRSSLAWLSGASLLGLSVLLTSWPLLGWQLALMRAGGALLIALLIVADAAGLRLLPQRAAARVPADEPSSRGAADAARARRRAAVGAADASASTAAMRGYLLARVDRDAPWLLAEPADRGTGRTVAAAGAVDGRCPAVAATAAVRS
jgi:hypothetical protein